MNFLATTIFVCAFSLICGIASFAVCFFFVRDQQRRFSDARRRDRRNLLEIGRDLRESYRLSLDAARDRLDRQTLDVYEKMEKNYQTVAKAVYELQGGETTPKRPTGLQAWRHDKEQRFIKKHGLENVPKVG